MGQFPGFTGSMGDSDFSTSIPWSPVALDLRYLRLGVSVRSRGCLPRRSPSSLAHLYRCATRGVCEGDVEISQVPAQSLHTCPALRPRWDLRARPHGPSVSPSAKSRASAPTDSSLRGSITRPACSLCTLHLAGRPTRCNTRSGAMVNLPRQDSHLRTASEEFQRSTSSCSPPGLPGALNFLCSHRCVPCSLITLLFISPTPTHSLGTAPRELVTSSPNFAHHLTTEPAGADRFGILNHKPSQRFARCATRFGRWFLC